MQLTYFWLEKEVLCKKCLHKSSADSTEYQEHHNVGLKLSAGAVYCRQCSAYTTSPGIARIYEKISSLDAQLDFYKE